MDTNILDTNILGTFFDVEDAAVGDFSDDETAADFLEQEEGWTGTKTVTILDKYKMLKQSNRLVVARYRLTKYEQRLVIAICSQIDKNAEKFDTVRVRAADVADFCNITGKDKYNQVHSTILKLMTRTLQIQKADGRWYVTHWLQSADYLEGGIIEYRIDERLKPELLQLKAAYLSSSTGHLMQFRRDYSARLYFMLKKMSKVGEFEFTLDFIRDRFQLEKGYRLFSNIRNRILEPALKEINEKSDITVSHLYIKEGRAVKKIKFIVKEKGLKNPIPPAGNGKDKLDKLTDEQQAAYDSLVNRGMGAEKAKKLAQRYDPKRIKSNLDLAVRQKDTAKNLPGLIISFIEQNAADKMALEKKNAKERIEKRQAERRQEKRVTVMEAVEKGEQNSRSLEDIARGSGVIADFAKKHILTQKPK